MAPNKTFKLKASHIQWLAQRDYLQEYVLLRKEQKSDQRAKRMADAVARTAQDLMVEFKVDGGERATVIKSERQPEITGQLGEAAKGQECRRALLRQVPQETRGGDPGCPTKDPTLISCNVHNRAVRNIYQALSKKERNYWEGEAERMKDTMQLTVEEKRSLADTSLETFVKNVQTTGPHINVQAYDLPATVAGARYFHDVFSAEATALGIELQDRDDSPGSKKTVPNIELETDDDGYPLLPEDVLQPEGRTGAGKLKYQRKVLREFIRLHYVIASNGLKNRVPWSLLTDSETVGDLIHPKYLPEDCPALIDPSRMVERDIAMLLGHWLHRQNDSRQVKGIRRREGTEKTAGQAKKKARRNEESSDDESSDDESSDDNRSDDDTSDEDISPEIDDDDEDDDEDKEEEHNMEAARAKKSAGDQEATEQEIAEFEMEEHFTGRMPTPDLISAMAAASPAQPTAATPMQSAAGMMPNLAAQTLSPSPAASGLKRVTGTITATAQGTIIKPAAHSSGLVNTPQLIGAGPTESPTTALEMANAKCPSQVDVSIPARKAFFHSLCSHQSFAALVKHHFAMKVLYTETEFQAIEGGKHWYRWTYKKPHPPQKLLEKPANEYLDWLRASFASTSLIRKSKLVYTGVQMEMLLINAGMLWRHATMLGQLSPNERKLAAGSNYWAKMEVNTRMSIASYPPHLTPWRRFSASPEEPRTATTAYNTYTNTTPYGTTHRTLTTSTGELVIDMMTAGGKVPERSEAIAESSTSGPASRKSKYGGGAIPRPATKVTVFRGMEDDTGADGPPAPIAKDIALTVNEDLNLGAAPPGVSNPSEKESEVEMSAKATAVDMSGPSQPTAQGIPVLGDGMVDDQDARPRSRSGRKIQPSLRVREAQQAAEPAKKGRAWIMMSMSPMAERRRGKPPRGEGKESKDKSIRCKRQGSCGEVQISG
ncbi:hypothetical protein BXZ70DRAFT_909869, partial [Cristinia sonorae]